MFTTIFPTCFYLWRNKGYKRWANAKTFFSLLAAFSLLLYREFGGGFVVVFCFQNAVDANPFLIAEFGFDVMSWAISKEGQSRNNMTSYASITKSSFHCDKPPHMADKISSSVWWEKLRSLKTQNQKTSTCKIVIFVAWTMGSLISQKKYFEEKTIFQIEISTWESISFLEDVRFEHTASILMGFLLISHTFAPPWGKTNCMNYWFSKYFTFIWMEAKETKIKSQIWNVLFSDLGHYGHHKNKVRRSWIIREWMPNVFFSTWGDIWMGNNSLWSMPYALCNPSNVWKYSVVQKPPKDKKEPISSIPKTKVRK